MERFGESFLLDNCTQARSNLQVGARAPRLPGGENLDQAVLGDFEYCCKLFEHRLLDIPKAFDTAPMLCLEMPLFVARWRA
jgi:hypothetical protein